jgi:hypothetical protein
MDVDAIAIILLLYYYRYVRNSSLFIATCENSPSARCVRAANRVCKDTDIFRMPITSLKQILR